MLQEARILALLSLFLTAFISPAFAADRYALVIGNSSYTGTTPLKNPKNDAELIGKTLKGVGFKVTIITDVNQKKMRRALLDFSRTLRNNPKSVGLFYYAGHGLQVDGNNYMVPVTADIKDEDEVRIEGVDVNDFLTTMRSSRSRLNIIILDACRNNPYARSFRSMSRGLAPVRAASGTLIAYSTAPGDVAFDGSGLNSPYTLALARYIDETGLRVETVFKRVLADVEDATDGKQIPWLNGAFRGEFYFKEKKASGAHIARADERGRPEKRSSFASSATTGHEKLFWESIVNSTNPASFNAYLSAFPEGTFTLLAKIKIDELKKASKKVVVASRSSEGKGNPKRPERLTGGSNSQAKNKYKELSSPGKNELEDGSEAPKVAVYKPIFAESSRLRLKRRVVAKLDCHKLWRARNEIYFRHGYCFKSELGIRVFDNSNCTTSKIRATPLESRNMRIIRTWEIRKRCRDNKLLDEAEGRSATMRPARPLFRPKNRVNRPKRKVVRSKPKSSSKRKAARPKPKSKKAFQPGGKSTLQQFLE